MQLKFGHSENGTKFEKKNRQLRFDVYFTLKGFKKISNLCSEWLNYTVYDYILGSLGSTYMNC